MGMARFGLRNLGRSKVRLAVVALLIGGPFFLLLAMQQIGEAVQHQTALLKRTVDNTLQLRARGSMGHVNMVGSSDVLPGNVLEKVETVEHVARVEPYLLAMSPTGGHNFAMHVGVNPGDTLRLESHGEAGNPRIIAGRALMPDDRGKDVGVIGQGYARFLGITPESLDRATLTIDTTRTHPAIFALNRPKRTLRIAGIYASGYVFGDMQVFMPLDTFREIYGVPSAISWLYVSVDSADHLPAVERTLRTLVGDVADIIAPISAAEFEQTTTRTVTRLTRWGVALSAALMVIVVFFVMLLIIRERAWEIGTLKAIGAGNGGIVLSFMTEALALCAVGAVLGTVLFLAWGGPLARRVFAVGMAPFLPAHYKDSFGATLSVSSTLGPTAIGFLIAVLVVVAAAGSAYALRQIVRLSPLEALRNE
ncbi:MAG: ABC transporter permease [Candidatus Rokuibacteriota bacterium]